MHLTLNDLGFLVTGAFIASIGVVFGALAQRIRAPRQDVIQRDIKPANERDIKPANGRAPRAVKAAPFIDAEWSEAIPAKRDHRGHHRIPVIKPEPIANATNADVVAALVQLGYKKQVAIAAVAACSAAEQRDEPTWLKAALRRCHQGAAS